jgi:cbb3-type cytochrome oxidase subunit 3
MQKNLIFTLFIIIFIITAFFRFWQIKSVPPGFYPDEAMNGNNALEVLETGEFKSFYPENNGREGLYINITALSLKIFKNKPWAVRSVSSVFGIFTVLGLFLLTKELFRFFRVQNRKSFNRERRNYFNETCSARFSGEQTGGKLWNKLKFKFFLNFKLQEDERIALLASFFLATSFWHINFSRIGFRAILAPFFLAWGIYFLLLSFKKNNNLKILILSASGGIFYGLGFYSYIAYRATPILIIALIFSYRLSKEAVNVKKFLLTASGYLLATAIVITPISFYFYNNPQDFLGRTSQISIFSGERPFYELGKNILKTTGMFWFKGDYNWRHNYSGAPQLWWPVGMLFGLGIIISFASIIRNANPKIKNSNSKFKLLKFLTMIPSFVFRVSRSFFITAHGFLILWLVVALLPVIVSSEGIPHALRAIIALPAVVIISGIALNWLILKSKDWLALQQIKFPQYARKINRIKKEALALLFIFFIAVTAHAFNQYFLKWSSNQNVASAFSDNYVKIGKYLNSLPQNLPKYVIVNAEGVRVRGIPMPAQTVMFVTKTFLPEWQKEKNIYYASPKDIEHLRTLFSSEDKLIIVMLENDHFLRKKLKEKIPSLQSDGSAGFVVLKK